ncbi:2-oxoacid:acceptor oxidoreductase family protein [Thermodesulfobacteriota bacterium]
MLFKSVFSGFGGQGVLMMGYVLAVAGMHEDKHVTFLPAYGAEMRGGTANCTVVVSDKEIASPIASSPEYVVAMNYPSMLKYQNTIPNGGTMFLNSDLIKEPPGREDVRVMRVPANSLAHEMGNDRVLNMIMLGAMCKDSNVVSEKSLAEAVETVLGGKKRALVDINRQALERGAQFIKAGD